MTRYAIDTDVLANIQRAHHAKTLMQLGQLPIVITDVVWDELTVGAVKTGKVHGSTISEMSKLLTAIAGTPTRLEPDTPEIEAFVRLHASSATEDAGEHSLIAYASHHSDTVAVLFDRTALHRAVEELRGRVLSIHGFLDVLRTRHGLSVGNADSISRKICAARSVVQPLWW